MGKAKKQNRKKSSEARNMKASKVISKPKALPKTRPSSLLEPKQFTSSPEARAPTSTASQNPQSTPSLETQLAARRRKPLSQHQQALQRKLESANFRMLNEALYTSTGAHAFSLMQSDPTLFTTYHAGYAQQTARWPANPLNDVLAVLATEGDDMVVADFGCGEARLAREANQQVHSFDLIASAPHVIACDMSKVPLADCSVDIAVFCLSLMGTNYGEYITEARRVLQMDGLLLIAEVASRFENHDPNEFVKAIEALGFEADDEHPFAKNVAKIGTQASPAVSHAKSFKAAKSTKRRGGAKHRKKMGTKSKGETTQMQEQHSAFFHKFAFRSTKESRNETVEAHRSYLPELAPCVYKKR